MGFIISAFIPFPSIAWWAVVQPCGVLKLDHAEHFQKMSYRNRYYLAGANGLIQLSIPLVQGRNQRMPMNQVQIANTGRWQVQQWRTITSAYKRSPYFDFYEPSLSALFDTPYALLSDFNAATIAWAAKQLNCTFRQETVDTFVKDYPTEVIDLRNMKPSTEKQLQGFPAYYQLFSERNGFLPNLSILDLLFTEGPFAANWLTAHHDALQQWLYKK